MINPESLILKMIRYIFKLLFLHQNYKKYNLKNAATYQYNNDDPTCKFRI